MFNSLKEKKITRLPDVETFSRCPSQISVQLFSIFADKINNLSRYLLFYDGNFRETDYFIRYEKKSNPWNSYDENNIS